MSNFELNSELLLGKSFQKLEINSFFEAMKYVKNLPYGRNSNREDFVLVLTENKGTCSSKHALLKSLADENSQFEFKLMLGIFKMNGINTPKVKETLNKFGIEYIPEAHNYLKINSIIYDCTTEISSEINFLPDLLEEMEINPEDVSTKKVEIHQNFLKNWCEKNSFKLEEIWGIREQCISDLGSKK